MKILKITTHWTPEEADCVFGFLAELQEVVWEHYGDDIVDMHLAIHDQQQKHNAEEPLNDEIPF